MPMGTIVKIAHWQGWVEVKSKAGACVQASLWQTVTHSTICQGLMH